MTEIRVVFSRPQKICVCGFSSSQKLWAIGGFTSTETLCMWCFHLPRKSGGVLFPLFQEIWAIHVHRKFVGVDDTLRDDDLFLVRVARCKMHSATTSDTTKCEKNCDNTRQRMAQIDTEWKMISRNDKKRVMRRRGRPSLTGNKAQEHQSLNQTSQHVEDSDLLRSYIETCQESLSILLEQSCQ
jgi:hypothetical protein